MDNKNFKEITTFLAETGDADTIRRFLKSILTPKEIQDLASRWQLVKMLENGVTQRKIADQLHISLCKITRGSRELKKQQSVLKKAIQNYL